MVKKKKTESLLIFQPYTEIYNYRYMCTTSRLPNLRITHTMFVYAMNYPSWNNYLKYLTIVFLFTCSSTFYGLGKL